MQRRTLLKRAGSIGATVSVLGGAGFATLSGSAAAAEIGTFDLSNAQTTTDDGTIDSFTVEAEVTAEYDGLDEDAEGVVMNFGVIHPDGETASLLSGTENNPNSRVDVPEADSLDTRAGTYTWDFGPFDVLENSDWTAADFEDTTEGDGPKVTEVEFYCLFAVRGADGTIDPPGQISDTGSLQVRVENETATGDTGVSGSSGVSGDDQSP